MPWPTVEDDVTDADKPFFEAIFSHTDALVSAETTRAVGAEGASGVRVGAEAGVGNVAIGAETLEHINETRGAIAIGAGAFKNLKSTGVEQHGRWGIAIGVGAGRNTTEGFSNILIGVQTGEANTTGFYLCAVGENALLLSKTGSRMMALGVSSMESVTSNAEHSTAIGDNTLGANGPGTPMTPGPWNTAVGSRTMQFATGGCELNTFIGGGAGSVLEAGGNANVGAGFEVMNALKTGKNNVGIGYKALQLATAAIENVCIGTEAGKNLTTAEAEQNVIIGQEALEKGKTTKLTVAIGGHTLNLSTGSNNVAVGTGAGREASTGSKNVLLGFNAGREMAAAEGCVFIGNEVGRTVTTNNTLVIGFNSTVAEAWVRGEANKIGFLGANPVVKPKTTGTIIGFTLGKAAAPTTEAIIKEQFEKSTFTGNTGATAYTIGDVVLALKQLGLLTA
jgi:hypothetical protein